MAEETLAERLMARIQKQTIINGIKHMFVKFPQARILLPFLKDSLESVKIESDNYLGDADNIIVIGRKKGITNIVIIDGKKPFTITTGLEIKQDKTNPAVTKIQSLNHYYKEIFDSGIFDDISEEDNKKFLEMKANGGIENLFDVNVLDKIVTPADDSGIPHEKFIEIKETKSQHQIEGPVTEIPEVADSAEPTLSKEIPSTEQSI